MKIESVQIAFADQRVGVHTGCANVLMVVRNGFEQLIDSKPGRIAGKVEIQRRYRKYKVLVNGERSAEDTSDIFQCIQREVVRQFVRERSDLIWFHAGAVADGDYGVAFVGTWGRGKSTLVSSLYTQGWTYLSDEVVPLDFASQSALPFPQTPKFRAYPGREIPRSDLGGVPKIRIRLDSTSVARGAVPIRALVFPAFSASSATEMRPMSPSETVAEMIENSLSVLRRRNEAIQCICRLLEQVPAYRLSFNDRYEACALIGRLRDESRRNRNSSLVRV